MPFTAAELANVSNSLLDYFADRPRVQDQSIQDKPLMARLNASAKDFPGGKGDISFAVKGDYTGELSGYTHDDQVTYYNPANTKRAAYPWKEMHIGIGMTLTELKMDGISVVDSLNSDELTRHDDREMTSLVNMIDEKFDEFDESYDISLNSLMWGDGTADADAIAGIRSMILESPAVGSTGGLNRASHSWWRNRAATAAYALAGGTDKITSASTGGGVLLKFLQKEYRQLRRYGGRPNLWIAGSDFIGAMEDEMRANGSYSQEGWMNSGKTDAGFADLKFKGNAIVYDPTLDTIGKSKFMYVLDIGPRAIHMRYMTGEKKKAHAPARPYDRYVMYRAYTTTGQLVTKRLNSSAVYEIA